MKKNYLPVIFLIQSVFCFSQIPGNFEARLVQPGGEPGVMRIQMRAISSVVPSTSDECLDLSFAIWWDNVLHPTIADIDVIQSTSLANCINEQAPTTGNSSGSGAPNGMVVKAGLTTACAGGFFFPANWVVNQWVNIATINICANADCNPAGAPSGITAADFLIQGYTGTSPNINVNFDDYLPSNGPLPLNLIAFDAKKSGDRNALMSWTTANEENTSHFIIQRSFDLNSWADAGKVGAAGYSIDIRNYELYDFEVYNGRDPRLQVYYRLVMVDLDGRSKLSPIKSVVFGNTSLANREFLVYPNPASNGVHIEWDVEEFNQPTALEFYDITGKLILTQQVSEKATQEYVDFTKTTMIPGLYLLRVMKGSEPIDYKQIVVGQR